MLNEHNGPNKITLPPAANDDDAMLTTAEAAALLGLAPATLCNWRVAGRGPAFRVIGGRAVRYLRADVLAFRDAGRRTSTSDPGIAA